MLLREVVGNNSESNVETVRLDGQCVSQQVLEERKKDKSVRVVEVSENEFKTLKHLQG